MNSQHVFFCERRKAKSSQVRFDNAWNVRKQTERNLQSNSGEQVSEHPENTTCKVLPNNIFVN